MPKLKHKSGTVASVSDELAAKLGSDWTPVDEKPKRRRAARKTTDDDEAADDASGGDSDE